MTTTYSNGGNNLGAMYNPFKYRGYYYDSEIGFYYLNSRYYDPATGRFISADGFVSTGQGILGLNMYAYCGNTPVIYADYSGYCYGHPNNTDLELPTSGKRYGILCGLYGLHARHPRKRGLSDTGAAIPFDEIAVGFTSNCYSFAIGSQTNEQPGATSGRVVTDWSNVEDVGASVVADLNAKGYSVRRLYGGVNVQVYANEYKIALRVGTHPYDFDEQGNPKYDYHFMRQTDTGCWAEKHGISGQPILWNSGVTPDDISWNYGRFSYYDSPIIYYAISN